MTWFNILILCCACVPFAGAAFMIAFAIRAIVRGEIQGGKIRSDITYRDSQPVSFWLSVCFSFAVATFLILAGLAAFGHAPSWFVHLMREYRSQPR